MVLHDFYKSFMLFTSLRRASALVISSYGRDRRDTVLPRQV